MSKNVVDVRNLSRRFEKSQALDGVSIEMTPGRVYGLVGANGQGKTTLIKHLLGLLRAQQGTVDVFGMNPVRHPVEVLQRIGYLSEERDLPEWMRVDELLRYTSAFHPRWDADYAKELLDTFQLDPSKKVKDLSKGMRAQAGLIAAVAHRPDLLLLDEPSTGLDAVVRKDILNAIVRMVADDGRTVLFSSHLLDEVEQMSDFVFMIDAGRLVLEGDLDEVKERHQRLIVRLAANFTLPPAGDCILAAEQRGSDWSLICHGDTTAIKDFLKREGAETVQSRCATLQEIFVAHVGRRMPTGAPAGDAK